MRAKNKSLGLWLGALLVFGCSGESPNFGTLPRISVPLEESPAPTEVEPASSPPPETVTLVGNTDPPDPPAQRTREQVEYHLSFDRGALKLLAQADHLQTEPVLTPRRVGRFAVELFLGPELVERVRFDFPLLGSDSDDPSLEKGLTTDARVLVPIIRRANRARVLDRKTRQQLELTWPPPAGGTLSEPPAGP